MWRLWNSVTRGIRYNVATTTATSTSGGASPSFADHDEHSRVSNKIVHRNQEETSLDLISRQQHKYQSDGNNTHDAFHFKWVNNQQDCTMFLEICGLSSALALGWQVSQCVHHQHRRDHQQDHQQEKQPENLLTKLVSVALAQPTLSRTRLSINKSKSDLPSQNNKRENLKIQSVTKTPPNKLSITEEIDKTMVSMMNKLEEGDSILMADWQNSIGVELMASAKKGEISSYEYLIPASTADRTATYLKEAFLCFKESRNLGSIKGAFNLGLCYEQGLGTHTNLKKAAECYEEAARQGHSGAQYNLGLLHYNRKLETSDFSKAITLMRQAARQGLEQAWSALLVVLHTAPRSSPSDFGISNSSSSIVDDISEGLRLSLANSSPSFRKTLSEPHDFNYSSDELHQDVEVRCDRQNEAVSFYLG